MAADAGNDKLVTESAGLDSRLRVAAMPLLLAAAGVSLLSALSGGPLDALAGLPMLLLSAVLLLGGTAGVETLVRLVAARERRQAGDTPLRRRFRLSPSHSPALRLLVAGRPLRGPPAAASA